MISRRTSGGPGPAREDLEEVALLVTVGLDAELLEDVDRHADVADAVGQRRVVLVRQTEELHPVVAEAAHGPDDVLGPDRDVLAAGRAIPVEVLLDLALLAPGAGSLIGNLIRPLPLVMTFDISALKSVWMTLSS